MERTWPECKIHYYRITNIFRSNEFYVNTIQRYIQTFFLAKFVLYVISVSIRPFVWGSKWSTAFIYFVKKHPSLVVRLEFEFHHSTQNVQMLLIELSKSDKAQINSHYLHIQEK